MTMLLWHRLPARPVSECGRLRHGAAGHRATAAGGGWVQFVLATLGSRAMNPVGRGTWDRRRWLALLLLPLLVAAALYLPGIGRRIIYSGDEARYAILARTMLETGDWLVPRISGEVRMAKTPLFIWSIAALSLPGGKVTELTAVLPAALSGIAGVGVTMLLARRMFGLRAALLTGFILATSWGYLSLARMALADMMVTFWVVASVAAFW